MGLDNPLQRPPTGDALKAIPANITAGNLSALEDDELAGKKLPLQPATPAPSPVIQRPPTPAHPISGPIQTSAAAQLKAPEKRGMGAIVGILVVVLFVAGLGVAWATHVIPH